MSRSGDLVIKGTRIDSRILEPAKIQRCVVAECQAACCTGGVWLNPDEMPRILEWADVVKTYIPPDRHDTETWFESGVPDESFPSGYEMGTNVVDDPVRPGQTCCVFLRPDRVCALQMASREHNLGWPGLKPFYCALYPLYVDEDTLTMDDETPLEFEGATCMRAASEPRAIFEIYREEAILVLGDDGYQELCEKASTTSPR